MSNFALALAAQRLQLPSTQDRRRFDEFEVATHFGAALTNGHRRVSC